jgi:putative nucleotidyltransferase with HDIG domain
VRGSFRRGANRVLAADAAWSAALVILTLLMLGTQRCGMEFESLSVGESAPYEIKAVSDFDVVDEGLTAERRRQAREAVPEVYTYDTERKKRLAAELSSVFRQGRQDLQQALVEGRQPDPVAAGVLGARADDKVAELLVRRRFEVALERSLVDALIEAMDGPLVGNKSLIEREPSILLLQVPGRREERVENYDHIRDVGEVREELRRNLSGRLDLPADQLRALFGFAASFLDANLHLDSEATERRRDDAANVIPAVRVRIPRGTQLVAKGKRLTPQDIATLDAARQGPVGAVGFRQALGLLFMVCMFAFFLLRYCRYHQRGFRKLEHLHALVVLMLLSMMLLTQGILWLARELVDNLAFPYNQLSGYAYLIPLGAGAILVALLANGRIAIVYSAFAALFFGAINGEDFYAAVWAMVVQLSGVYAISTYRERAALLRAGLVVGGAGAVTALAVETLKGDLEPLSRSFYGAGLAFAGGAVGVGLLISFSLPLLEGLFNVLTDIRLLELSNVNNPLLSQLAVKAPGSYNHSLVVGTLAEEAAKSIGANSLFCRVAAIYHDIGKINHAEYYVENQRGVNPHDRLSPSMSSLIIASHVKDGIKLTREARIPEQIVDIIPQHHGTKLMTYFYEKARNSADPSLGPVKQEDFRYPGPKPQTREAAIFMLADSIEAAARTIEEPTANRLKEMIRKITSSIVLDGQLDSCDLTFADLERIQQAFLRLLISMYHHRVDYPGFDFRRSKGEPKESKPVGELQDSRVARGS